MSPSSFRNLFSMAKNMLESTNPYSKPVEKLVYTYCDDDCEEVHDFCEMLKRNLAIERFETGRTNSDLNNKRKCIEQIEAAMLDYLQDFPGPYSVAQNHRYKFGIWIQKIVSRYGKGMAYELPKELQYDNENQSTVVLLLKELQNRRGVTKEELRERLQLKPRQIAKDLRKLDHSLIQSPETADMSDYVPFRIGGQPVRVKISASRNPENSADKSLYFKTVNSLHPIVLQENMMQAGTLIQALCRNYYEYESSVSLYIATDIWYQLSDYAKSRIRLLYRFDQDMQSFLDTMEEDFPDGNRERYVTERNLYQEGDFSDEEMLLYFVKVSDRRCNITLRDASGVRRILNDQSLSIAQDGDGRAVYIATGREGETVSFSKSEFFDIEECRD